MRSRKEKTALYRCYGEDGFLLYVGISFYPLSRLESHTALANWSRRISTISITWYENRRKALKAERETVQLETPLFNIRLHKEQIKLIKIRRIKPKNSTQFVGFRLPESRVAKILDRAEQENRSFSGQVRWMLEHPCVNEKD